MHDVAIALDHVVPQKASNHQIQLAKGGLVANLKSRDLIHDDVSSFCRSTKVFAIVPRFGHRLFRVAISRPAVLASGVLGR